MSARDADAALDILRYTFPEVEHRWLSNRFERSMRASLTVADVLASAASGRDETERMAIALEVLSLLINTGDARMTGDLLAQVTCGLELPGTATPLRQLRSESVVPPAAVRRYPSRSRIRAFPSA